MADTRTLSTPVWVDLSSTDAAAARRYYSKLFGWEINVEPDPAAGGYAMANVQGKSVAGIGPTQDPHGHSAWMLYVGTDDADATAKKVESAGGKVVAPPFDVMTHGRMAVFQDAGGAFLSVWQPRDMSGAALKGVPNTFAWAELNARGVESSRPFYLQVFGWTERTSEMGEGAPPYTEFQVDGVSIAGAMEMPAPVPADVPNHWLIYFGVDDVDRAFKTATDEGGRGLAGPQDFPGGRFAVLEDPQGAVFGILKMEQG